MHFLVFHLEKERREKNFFKLPIIIVNLVICATKGNMLNEIWQETAKDQFLLQLLEFIMNGFPQKKFPSHLHIFWNFRDELSIENGIILKSHNILIPYSIQCKILELIHKGHLGKEKCINYTRNHVYWIDIYNHIRQLVDKSGICQKPRTSKGSFHPLWVKSHHFHGKH